MIFGPMRRKHFSNFEQIYLVNYVYTTSATNQVYHKNNFKTLRSLLVHKLYVFTKVNLSLGCATPDQLPFVNTY